MIPKLSKILILTVCLASVSLADDFKTVDGKEYKNAKVSRVEPDGIVITFSGGIVKLPFAELSPEVQKRYGFDPIAEEKRRAEQEALEDKQVEEQKAVAREQAEGEKNAEADLTQSREQSQAAEQRAAQIEALQKGLYLVKSSYPREGVRALRRHQDSATKRPAWCCTGQSQASGGE
ncbi:MAG: hypothetical protein DMF21_09955 [Verrucomicrobia bacterium]|nr:MAG: hypothetical protein DMF21_09955 [Verrucomicrobiota bacterium]